MSEPVRRGRFTMLIVDKSLVVVARKYRCKWWEVWCPCGPSRRRKDGSCKHERVAFELLIPKVKKWARIVRKLGE